MHRATPLNTSHRAYSAGGARSVVDKVDDSKLMQEMGGNFMKNETRSAVESPQNYGFTSVVHDSDKDKDGNITDGAETFISFIGGNRSFPVAGNMDDRRHRLTGLEKGDTAMFRGKDDKQQFHMTTDGGFWSAPGGKTLRMALVAASQTAGAHTTAAGGNGGSQQQGQQQQRGQKSVKKDNQDASKFVDITDNASRIAGKNTHLMLDDKKVYVHVADDKKVYLGGERGKGVFAPVMTAMGPSPYVLAKISD